MSHVRLQVVGHQVLHTVSTSMGKEGGREGESLACWSAQEPGKTHRARRNSKGFLSGVYNLAAGPEGGNKGGPLVA